MEKKYSLLPIILLFSQNIVTQPAEALVEESLLRSRRPHHEEPVHIRPRGASHAGPGRTFVYQKPVFTPPLLPVVSVPEGGEAVSQRPPPVPPKPKGRQLSNVQQLLQPEVPPQPAPVSALPKWEFQQQHLVPLSMPVTPRSAQEERIATEAKRAAEIKQLQGKITETQEALMQKNLPAERAATARQEAARWKALQEKLRKRVLKGK